MFERLCDHQDMDGEPIDIAQQYGRTAARRWRTGDGEGWRTTHITLGQLADGRWWVDTTDSTANPNAWAWPDRAGAEAHVAELLAERTDWVHVPAWFDGDGTPHGELGPWRKAGRNWVLDEGLANLDQR